MCDDLEMDKEVLLVILAKDKERELPLFFECIKNQTYDKKLIHLYIRSNDNKDRTIEIIEEWLKENESYYASCFKDYSNVNSNLKNFKSHEWNGLRFSILGKIRQDSINYAIKKNLNYFVVDCDNFLKPWVLEKMVRCNLEVVSPLLVIPPHYRVSGREHGPMYSNFHFEIDSNGYYRDSYNRYSDVYHQVFKGYVECKVVHCTYYIMKECLPYCNYLDYTGRHEYVIFSHYLRIAEVPQYLYNRECGGYLVLIQEGEQVGLTYVDVLEAE